MKSPGTTSRWKCGTPPSPGGIAAPSATRSVQQLGRPGVAIAIGFVGSGLPWPLVPSVMTRGASAVAAGVPPAGLRAWKPSRFATPPDRTLSSRPKEAEARVVTSRSKVAPPLAPPAGICAAALVAPRVSPPLSAKRTTTRLCAGSNGNGPTAVTKIAKVGVAFALI